MDELYTMTDAERQEYEAEYNEWLDSIALPLPTPEEDFFDELNEYEELEEEYIDDPYTDEDEETAGYYGWQAEHELDFN